MAIDTTEITAQLQEDIQAGVDVTKNTILEWLNIQLFSIGDDPVTPLELMKGLGIFIFALVISHYGRKAIDRFSEKQKHVDPSHLYTIERVFHYVIVSLGIILALSSIGVNFRNLAIVAGALSVGIGFGLQSMVSNFVSGLIILFDKNIKVGDFIEVEKEKGGKITEINIRSTIIRTNDGVEVMVPNSELVSNRVTNWTMSDDYRRLHIPFGVAYGSDKELVKKVVLEAAENVQFTLKGFSKYKPPTIRLVKFGDSSLDFELVVWVNRVATKRLGSTKSAFLWEIHSALVENNIEIPYPQRDVHIRSGEKV